MKKYSFSIDFMSTVVYNNRCDCGQTTIKGVFMPFVAVKIKVPTLKELLLTQLENQILLGNLKIGEKLPSEREMSQQFSTSKTAIHDAICELERKGFVEVVPRKGVYIADYLRTGTIDTFFALLRFNGGKLDENTTKSIIDVRRYIEIPSIKGAIDNLAGENCPALDEILQRGRTACADGDSHGLAECLFEFTREVCIQSKNLITPMLFNAFKPLTIPFWEEDLKRNGLEYGLNVLENYYDALKNRNVKRAEDVVNADLNTFLSFT